ncbi:TPA: tyrosine-type recombinase/integrase [Kluyvera ascorbata]|nr:tyrosine-type recombinase/integrase [Kluyvera ascorbata]
MNTITLSEWLSAYETLIINRIDEGKITLKTAEDYCRTIRFCRRTWPERLLTDITVMEITHAVHEKARDAPHAARRIRLNMSDMFTEAQRAAVVPLGHNPALVSRWPRTSVKTERLMLEEWTAIFRVATYRAPGYFQTAMLLAILTAQRPSDLVKMHRNDIHDDRMLRIEQLKTGERIALPLRLQLSCLGTSLADVLSLSAPCGRLLQNRDGKDVHTWNLSYWWRICREAAGVTATRGTPPTFREQRSLSERLFRAQGIDTQTLLGHKYQRMTDSYHDLRGKGFRELML